MNICLNHFRLPTRLCWTCAAALVFCSPSALRAEEPEPAAESKPGQAVIVVLGAAGAPEYEQPFQEWFARWKAAAEKGGADFQSVGDDKQGPQNDRDLLRDVLKTASSSHTTEPLWLVLIGHGTFDGRAAKFNLRGPDISAKELGEWIVEAQRPLAIINCASSSGPFINRLSQANRVIITASKSGYQYNFARFGDYMSQAISGESDLDGPVDLDKDGQTSLLEAYLSAAKRVQEFYDAEGRLATEHALIDDNGDKLGASASFFQGVRAVKSAKEGAEVDGRRAAQLVLVRSASEQALSAEQRADRDRIEIAIARLRERKAAMDQDAYYQQLESLLVELAGVLLPE